MPERTCTNCGSTVPDGARFCTTCGTEAPAATAPEPYTEPVAPTTQLPPAEAAAPAWTPPPEQPPAAPAWAPPPGPAGTAGRAAAVVVRARRPAQPAPPTQSWQQPQPAGRPGLAAAPAAAGVARAAAPAVRRGRPAKKKGNVPGALLAFLGAILLVVGSFTQWVRTNVETITGWEASVDGKVVVGLAVGRPADRPRADRRGPQHRAAPGPARHRGVGDRHRDRRHHRRRQPARLPRARRRRRPLPRGCGRRRPAASPAWSPVEGGRASQPDLRRTA